MFLHERTSKVILPTSFTALHKCSAYTILSKKAFVPLNSINTTTKYYSLLTVSKYLIFPCGSENSPSGNLAIKRFPSPLNKVEHPICVVSNRQTQLTTGTFVKCEFIFRTKSDLEHFRESMYCLHRKELLLIIRFN